LDRDRERESGRWGGGSEKKRERARRDRVYAEHRGGSKMVKKQRQEDMASDKNVERRTVFGRESELHDRRKSEREY
jgi:hypothetical protein